MKSIVLQIIPLSVTLFDSFQAFEVNQHVNSSLKFVLFTYWHLERLLGLNWSPHCGQTSFTSNNAKAKKELAIMDEIWTLQFEDRCGSKKTTQAEWERVHSQINETPAGAPTVLSVLSWSALLVNLHHFFSLHFVSILKKKKKELLLMFSQP